MQAENVHINSRAIRQVQKTWPGGLNLKDPRTMIQDEQVIGGENMIFTDIGLAHKRLGSVQKSTGTQPTGKVVGMADFYTGETNKSDVVLVCAGAKLYSFNETTGALTTVKTGLAADRQAYFEVIGNGVDNDNICVMVNGYDTPLKVDKDLATSLVGSSPPSAATYVRKFKNRLWFSTGNEMTFSNTGNPDAGYDNSFQIGTSEFPVVAFMGRGDNIYIWKANELYAMRPSDDVDAVLTEISIIDPSVGCGAAGTLAYSTYGTFIWLGGDRKLYDMSGEVPRYISRNIQPVLDAIPNNKLAYCVGAQFGDYYRLAIPSSGQYNDTEYWINLKALDAGNEQWSTEITGRRVGVYLPLVNEGRDRKLYYGDSLYGRVYQADYSEYTDSGNEYACSMLTKLYPMSGERRYGLYSKLYLEYDGIGRLTLSAMREDENTTSVGSVTAQTGAPFGTELTFAELEAAGATFGSFESEHNETSVNFPAGYRHRNVGIKIQENSVKPFTLLGMQVILQTSGGLL